MKLSMKALTLGVVAIIVMSISAACNRGPSDETLVKNVQAKLKADPTLAKSPITVTASSGIVTLVGEVTSEANKSRAEELAKGVEGVKSVTNNLVTKPQMPVIAQDEPLKTQVMANFAKYGIKGVTVTVANGEVTLTGNIARAKLQDVMKAVNEAHPKKINNKLTIK